MTFVFDCSPGPIVQYAVADTPHEALEALMAALPIASTV